jgi:hypothetical protein
MKAFSRMALRKRVEQLVSLAAVLALLTTALSSALASDLPVTANGEPGPTQSYTVSDCEALLVQAAGHTPSRDTDYPVT